MKKQQLLCTFVTPGTLNLTLVYIQTYYKITNGKIFVYKESEKSNYIGPNTLLVYNIDDTLKDNNLARNTILIHRKKQYNSFYTINALNCLITAINNGVLDKNYPIQWENYTNVLLTVVESNLKTTPIFFQKILYL